MAGLTEAHQIVQRPLEISTVQPTDYGTLTTFQDLLGNTLRTVLDEINGGPRTVVTTTFNGAEIPVLIVTVEHGNDLVITTIRRDDTGKFVSGLRVTETSLSVTTQEFGPRGTLLSNTLTFKQDMDDDRLPAHQELGYA